MKVINLIAGPGVGKSTTASGIFYELKKRGFNAEYIQEYAKDMTWEGRYSVLEDQLYISAKQNRRLVRIDGKIDIAITDSPLILGLAYAPPTYYSSFKQLLLEIFHSYKNINYYLQRKHDYNPLGRNQTEVEALQIDELLLTMLDTHNISYTNVGFDGEYVESIIRHLEENNLLK
jgi:tRNA uridine 5-carbamoylmethylation protein Kti12